MNMISDLALDLGVFQLDHELKDGMARRIPPRSRFPTSGFRGMAARRKDPNANIGATAMRERQMESAWGDITFRVLRFFG